MKWSLVFLVLAGVCAAVNADCCRCEADQNDIAVRAEGKVVSVTVNPERGDCKREVDKFVGEIQWGDQWRQSTTIIQSSPAKFTRSFKYDYYGCYDILVMYGGDNSYCGTYKHHTIELKGPPGTCTCATGQLPPLVEKKGLSVVVTVRPTQGSCPRQVNYYLCVINFGDNDKNWSTISQEVKEGTFPHDYSSPGKYTITVLYGANNQYCGVHREIEVTLP